MSWETRRAVALAVLEEWPGLLLIGLIQVGCSALALVAGRHPGPMWLVLISGLVWLAVGAYGATHCGDRG